jgi:uncharacterized membrane protein HdeD (DUF308 family)
MAKTDAPPGSQSQWWKGECGMNERHGFPTLPESDSHWRWLLTLGVGLILLGVVELGSVVALELLAILVLGPLLLASGIMQILLAFFARRREAPLHLAAAALDIVVGFLVLTHPHNTVDDLILVLAVFLLAGGVSRILSSLFLRFRAWGWVLAAGIIAVTLGLVVWKVGPFRGLSIVLACVAVDFISHGVSWVVLSYNARNGSPAAPKDGPTSPDAARKGHAVVEQPAHRPR